MLNKIIEHYGFTEQTRQAIEELNELAVAVNKMHRDHSRIAMCNLIQEIADVEIMIAQLKIMFNISEADVSKIKGKKIERTLRKIEKDKLLEVTK